MNDPRQQKPADNGVGSDAVVGAKLAANIRFYENDLGCLHMPRALGMHRMPEGYALMLNYDRTHYFWINHESREGGIEWDRWRVRRGAIAHANRHTQGPNR